jgi:hypothetical protein
VPYSGPGLCRTVETVGFECGLKPLGASNIGNDRKGCSNSTRKQQGLFNDFISGNSNSCSHGRRKQQGLLNESTAAAAGSKGCLLRRHQRQLSENSTDFLWRPIRQEDL